MSAFGPIYDNPFGTVGDLALIPDLSTKVDVEFAGFAPERFCLADIMTAEGEVLPSPPAQLPEARPRGAPHGSRIRDPLGLRAGIRLYGRR